MVTAAVGMLIVAFELVLMHSSGGVLFSQQNLVVQGRRLAPTEKLAATAFSM